MFLTRSEYDRGVNTFSPEGRLFQVEYAMEAVKVGAFDWLPILSSDSSLAPPPSEYTPRRALCWQLSVELFLVWSWRIPSAKCQKLTVTLVGLSIQTNLNYKKIFAASAGLIADARTWVERARNEAQQYTFVYGQKMRVQDVTMRVN